MTFNELPLREEILRAIEELGYTEATTIQADAIPPILEGKDVTGRSSTGTGKTAAFGIPVVQRTADNNNKASVLILSPTRELAVQTAGEIRKFAKYLPGLATAVVYGGQPMDGQIRALRTAKIVIGTPGRVMDHMRRRTLKLENLQTVVLDEADEMLNMGFIDDIRTILESAPENRQTVLFSATLPKAIMDITKDFQHDPVLIKADGGQRTVSNIEQTFYNIPQAGKNDALKLLMEYHRPKRALVFCNTKKMVDELAALLTDAGFKASGLHGDLKQSQRNTVMADFKAGRAKILVATDVAARGIDVDDVEAVFNYDLPQEYEYYIHRIGRTGRAGREGASYSLVANRNQLRRMQEIERYVGAPITEKPVPSIESVATNRMTDFATEIKDMLTEGADDGWSSFVTDLVAEGFAAEDIAAVLCARVMKKNKRLASVRNVASMGGGKKLHDASAGKEWVRVDIGSDDKIGPNFIVGAIVEAVSIPATAVGKINIFADHTDIELSHEDALLVLREMKNSKIKGRAVEFSTVEQGGKTSGYKGRSGMHSARKAPAGRKSYGAKEGKSFGGKGKSYEGKGYAGKGKRKPSL